LQITLAIPGKECVKSRWRFCQVIALLREDRTTASCPGKAFLIADAYVKKRVASIVKGQELRRYVL